MEDTGASRYKWLVNGECAGEGPGFPPHVIVKEDDQVQLVVSNGNGKFVTNAHIYRQLEEK